METTKKKVAVIGALNVDIGGRPEGPLARGDSIPGRVSTSLGGVGWNIARDCALLGAETAFISLLGRDGHRDAILADGARCGVDMSRCQWTDGPNDRYLYICDERGDVAAAVNDMALCGRMDEAFAAACGALEGFGAVVVDANLPERTLEALARSVQAPLAADCVSVTKGTRLRPILARLHTLKANRREAQALTGLARPLDCARVLLDAGVKRAVITLGAEGVLCAEAKTVLRLPAAAVRTVDATGAGDSMTAALAVGLAAGLPLDGCARLGVAAAGLTVSCPGSVTERLRTLAGSY